MTGCRVSRAATVLHHGQIQCDPSARMASLMGSLDHDTHRSRKRRHPEKGSNPLETSKGSNPLETSNVVQGPAKRFRTHHLRTTNPRDGRPTMSLITGSRTRSPRL